MYTSEALPLMLETTECLDDPVGCHCPVNYVIPDASWSEVGVDLSEELESLLHFFVTGEEQ